MTAHANFDDGEDDDIIAAINIVPFVDIVLVLLIIFMVTSTALVKASLKVDMPKAASAGSAVESTLNIVYTLSDELFLNGEPATQEEIRAYVLRTLPSEPKLQAVIVADKGVSYGKVIALIDLVKRNGVNAFALNIERASPEKLSSPTPSVQ